MITVKIKDILNGLDILQKLSNMPLKAKPSARVGKLLKEIDKEIQEFYNARTKLIETYGEKNEYGKLVIDENGNYKIQEDKQKQFSEELDELIDMDIEISALKIDLNDISDTVFTPNEMILLEPFIEM